MKNVEPRTGAGLEKKNWVLIAALAAGLLIGWLDFHATEVQGTVLLILIFSFGFSFVNARWAWLIALLIGGGVYGVAAMARTLGLRPTDPIPSNPWWAAIVLPLIIAFVAAYAAVLLRWLIGKSTQAVHE